MKLTKVASNCEGGPCPTVWDTGTADVIVQGFKVDDPEALETMDYNDKGEFLGAQREPESDADKWLSIRDTALAEAVPFAEWWAEHGSE
ncbi:MAG: DUF6879 family protein [Micromonosporaceae bacterium]